MEILNRAKQLLPKAKPQELEFAVELVCDSIKNYCNLLEVPKGLWNVAVSMAIDAYKQTETLTTESLQAKGVSRGDTSYTFAVPAEQLQAVVNSPVFARQYTAQLNAFRKMRW